MYFYFRWSQAHNQFEKIKRRKVQIQGAVGVSEITYRNHVFDTHFLHSSNITNYKNTFHKHCVSRVHSICFSNLNNSAGRRKTLTKSSHIFQVNTYVLEVLLSDMHITSPDWNPWILFEDLGKVVLFFFFFPVPMIRNAIFFRRCLSGWREAWHEPVICACSPET